MNKGMSFQEFVSALVDEVNKRGSDWADVPVMVAGNGTFSMASLKCVQFQDIPEQTREINSKWNFEKKTWDKTTETIPAHKVVVFSAPESDSMI